jgi:hypothetical protein
MVVVERPRMVAYIRLQSAEPRLPPLPAAEINQPSADDPTKAATIFTNGKPAPAPSPSLTWISQPTEPRRKLEPRPRDTATSQPALKSSRQGRMIVERLAVQRRGRRRTGSSMLHQCPGGVPVRCNGLLDGGAIRLRAAAAQDLLVRLLNRWEHLEQSRLRDPFLHRPD